MLEFPMARKEAEGSLRGLKHLVVSNPAQPGVAPPDTKQGKLRLKQIAEVIYGTTNLGKSDDRGNSFEGKRDDWYPVEGRVSIEDAAQKEWRLKGDHDDAVESENLYDSDYRTERGLPPCQRRKGSRFS